MEILHGESAVAGVQTGIQNCHHHTATVIAAVAAIENTGIVNADRVLNQLGLGNFVLLADHYAAALIQGAANALKVAGCNSKLKTAQQNIIVIAGSIVDALLVQLGKDLLLFRSDGFPQSGSILAVGSILLKAHGLIALLIGIHQSGLVQGDNDADLLIRLYGIRQLLHHRAVKVILVIYLYTAKLLNIGSIVTGGFCIWGCNYADQDRRHNHQKHRCAGKSFAVFLHHLSIAFLLYS